MPSSNNPVTSRTTTWLVNAAAVLTAIAILHGPAQAEQFAVVGGGEYTTDDGGRGLFSISLRTDGESSTGVACLHLPNARSIQ